MSLRRKIHAFTLVELLVVIGIIALLVSILLPALSRAREQALLVACSAQLKDLYNGIAMYGQYNQGYFPGPIQGRMSAGYWQGGPKVIQNYIAHYMKWTEWDGNPGTPGSDSSHPIITPSIWCPGYRAKASGAVPDASQYTYLTYGWDPYPWFGYVSESSAGTPLYPLYEQAKYGSVSASHTIYPLKQSQVFDAPGNPLLGDIDQGEVNYDTPKPNDTTTSEYPNHGGKAETKNGLLELPNSAGGLASPFYLILNGGKNATNPPRNYLYADGHVVTIRRSGPALPSNLQRYRGSRVVPAGILLP